MNWSKPLPTIEETDISVFTGGLSMLWMLAVHGLPKTGKNIIWMFEPLIETNIFAETVRKIIRRFKSFMGIEASDFHYGKTKTMNAIGQKLDAIVGFNSLVTKYAERHFPTVPVIEIPYTVDPQHIISPLPEAERHIDILQLGRRSSRREQAERLFNRRGGVKATFIYAGLYNEHRYEVISQSKISLQIHGSRPFYFNQHRIFEAWAAGSVVVSEAFSPEMDGVEEGKHLIVAELEDFPEVCNELLADREKRHEIVNASQELLKSSFLPDKWSDDLLRVLASVMP